MMNLRRTKPYTAGWLPVSQAAKALQNQADTIFDELHISIERARAARVKMDFLAKQKAWYEAQADSGVYHGFPDTRSSLDEYRYGMSNFGMPVRQVPTLSAEPTLPGRQWHNADFWENEP